VIVVSNTSPIINLACVGRLDLLKRLYGQVHIPEAVYQEVVVTGAGKPGAREVETDPCFVRCALDDQILAVALQLELDAGEASAIALAVERDVDLILLDERRARAVAKRYSLPVMGLLGVLVQAKQRGLLDEVSSVIEALKQRAAFRISANLERRVLQAVEEL